MFPRHAVDDLAAYIEDQLDAPSRARVDAHLAVCPRCRAELDQVRRGIALASELEPEAMPAAVAARVKETLADAGATGDAFVVPSIWLPRRRPAALAVAAALVVLAAVWAMDRPRAELHHGDEASIAFEREARAIHDRLRRGEPMQMNTADEARMRQWMTEQRAPIASIAVQRPADERRRFVARGISIGRVAGARASMLEYAIDGRAVTLVVASQADVPDAPPAAWLSKRIAHRRTADGRNTLTWSTGGQTYVLVSELEGLGQRACFICHTDTSFRMAIERLTLR